MCFHGVQANFQQPSGQSPEWPNPIKFALLWASPGRVGRERWVTIGQMALGKQLERAAPDSSWRGTDHLPGCLKRAERVGYFAFSGTGAGVLASPAPVGTSSSMVISFTCTWALPPPWTWMPILPVCTILGSASV